MTALTVLLTLQIKIMLFYCSFELTFGNISFQNVEKLLKRRTVKTIKHTEITGKSLQVGAYS